MAASIDAREMWRRFGGGPKTAAEQERRDAINRALCGERFDEADIRDTGPALRALLAEIDRTHAAPSVAANALCIVARGGRVRREYDAAAVWLSIRARAAAQGATR